MLNSIKTLPVLRPLLKWRYERMFARHPSANLFRGVYPDFATARATIPTTKPEGYDNPEPAAMYADRLDQVDASDYPLLFWLSRLVGGTGRVFDFGGHIGIGYHAFSRYVSFPADLKWTVYDVPAVVEAGRRIAADRGAAALSFTTSLADGDGADILIAAGALQYLDDLSIGRILGSFAHKPRHVLINKTPLHDRACVTLQSIGTAFCPYRIFQREDFIRSVTSLGYRLVDEWQSALQCHVQFEPAHSVKEYTGLYFCRLDD